MRNPALHLVGIAASPGGGGVFGTRAEEELRHWLEQRLDALGIDPVAYSRCVLSLLRRPDSALTPPLDVTGYNRYASGGVGGRRSKSRPRSKLPNQGDREQRRAVVQCLTRAADETCGVETLVDELCAKLKDLEGGQSKEEQREITATDGEAKVPFETLTPQDRALRYYAAFPALQSTTPKKFPLKKERNSGTSSSSSSNNNNNIINNKNNNNNINNNYNNNKKNSVISNSNNKSNKTRPKKNKLSLLIKEKNFGFAKSMEQTKEKEQELAMDQLKLAQLKAKFDQSLEALWDTGPGISQGSDSIWAAPSLSIPSKPLWPTDNADSSFPMNTLEKNIKEGPLYQKFPIDNSPLISWDGDSYSIEDVSAESKYQNSKTQNKVSWAGSAGDGPWCWGGLGFGHTPRSGSCFSSAVSIKSPVLNEKESCLKPKVSSIQEADEDLLTSARTHFRPIKEDGHWADGTTFPINNNFERVMYRRSESGNLLYLPGGESPYMEYRESQIEEPIGVPSNLTIKFRVHQCDKSIQTDPIRSPVKRRFLPDQDRFYYATKEVKEMSINDIEEIEKDSFDFEEIGWDHPIMILRSERKRRHSSSFKPRPLPVLRPLTL